jgi:hypothetical protein
MAIETIEIGNAKDNQIAVTLRGEPEQVIKALVSGLSREALQQINDALVDELARRKVAPEKA